jgi:serine/threonine protein kinase
MGLLGPSITHLQEEQPEYKFAIGTVLRVGLQAVRVSFFYIKIYSMFNFSQALAYLHHIHFVHRDVKPSNFAIDQTNPRRIYLIDYGLARSMKKRGCKKLRKERQG